MLVAVDPSGAWASHHTFLADGTRVSSVEWNHSSRAFAWSAVHERLYFFRDGMSPNDLHYEEIDPVTGEIGNGGESPYHGDFAILPPIRVSPDESQVILGSGDVYDALSLLVVRSLPHRFVDAVWTEDALVTIHEENGRTQVEQWNRDFELVAFEFLDGVPLSIFAWNGAFSIATLVAGQPVFHAYALDDDGDDDGVLNANDDFPLDPAASLDSDGDGYPDAWNPGMQAEESTTGLTLDAFPDDFRLPDRSTRRRGRMRLRLDASERPG